MSSVYQYEELPVGRVIRLLKLFPGASDEQIQLELFTATLDSPPPYEAISYCWGDASDVQEIICCGQTMHIARSLYSGLRCFRDSKNARILWADAICVNQSDNHEKGIQVNMMGNVYDQATRVLIWLGEGSEADAKLAFNLIRRINDYFESQIVESVLVVDPAKALRNVRIQENWAQVFEKDSQSQLLGKLFHRPWFYRLWVLQEVALATSAWLFYEGVSISFSEVIQSSFILTFCPEIEGKYHDGILTNAFIAILSTYGKENTWIQEKSILRHARNYIHRNFEITFNQVLQTGRWLEASNPLDHIYVFLGHPTARAGLESSGILEADYNVTIEEASRRLVERLYGRDHRLEFLCDIVHSSLSGLDNFPSWVPDFQSKRGGYTMQHPSFKADNSEITQNFACAAIKNNKLEGCGIIFDTIAACSETFTYQDMKSSSPHPIELCWHLQSKFYETKKMEDKIKRFAWTLSGGSYTDTEGNLLRDFQSYCRKHFSSQTYATMPFHEFASESMNATTDGRGVFESQKVVSLLGKRFFITGDGHFGLGSSALEVGDSCCVLLGCKMPLVIRQTATEGHFKLRGVCYVYGAMGGKVVEGVKSASDLAEITLV